MRILPEEILNVLGYKFNAITDEQRLEEVFSCFFVAGKFPRNLCYN
jgi:hypothetical protein